MKDKAQLQSTAYHEAGHAVAAWALGVKVRSVTIVPNSDALGSAAHARIVTKRELDAFEFGSLCRFTGEATALRTAVISLAGMVAQRRHAPRSVLRAHWRDDRETVNLIIYRVVGSDEQEAKYWYRRALRRAERIIERDWPAVEAVARALIKKRLLSGADALAAIQSAYELPKAERRRIAKLVIDAKPSALKSK